MAKRPLLFVPIAVGFLFLGGRVTGAQDDTTNIRVNVDLVQLNVAVTDSKGNYISGLWSGELCHHRGQNPGETCHL